MSHYDEHDEHDERERRERRPAPNRRADYPHEFYTPPRRRSADLGTIERLLSRIGGFGPLFSLVTLLYLAVGFKTIRPNDRLVSVEDQLIALKARRDTDHAEFTRLIHEAVDSLSRAVAPTQKRTSALARYRCLHLDAETAYTLDLDCDVLLPGYQRFKRTPGKDDETGALPFLKDTLHVGLAARSPLPLPPVHLPVLVVRTTPALPAHTVRTLSDLRY